MNPTTGSDTAIVSVITPVLNEATRLCKALDSLAKQQGVAIEHIIVDGGSTDTTLSVATQYRDSAPYPVKILTGVDGGVYPALNAGIAASSGKYIATLHANDSFAIDDALARSIELLESTHTDLSFADLHYTNAAGRRVRYYSGAKFKPERLLDGFMPPHPTIVARRKLFERIGNYNPIYTIAADYDWLCRAMLIHNATCIYLPVDMVEMSPGGISGLWKNRLWFTNLDKLHSLRDNKLPASPLRLLKRYLYL